VSLSLYVLGIRDLPLEHQVPSVRKIIIKMANKRRKQAKSKQDDDQQTQVAANVPVDKPKRIET
jgi:hypothetical protein